MIKCDSGKRSYATQELAEAALIDANTLYHYSHTKRPIAVYKCDECGNYHLTSQGPINPKLDQFIKEGKLDLQKEANRWIEKFKW